MTRITCFRKLPFEQRELRHPDDAVRIDPFLDLPVREDGWDGSGADQVDRRPFRQKRQHFLLRRVVGQSHEPPHQPVEDWVPDLEEDEVQRHRIDEVLFGECGRPHDVDDLRDARRVLQAEAQLRRIVLVVGIEQREMPASGLAHDDEPRLRHAKRSGEGTHFGDRRVDVAQHLRERRLLAGRL